VSHGRLGYVSSEMEWISGLSSSRKWLKRGGTCHSSDDEELSQSEQLNTAQAIGPSSVFSEYIFV
jgi:hypothetical protein